MVKKCRNIVHHQIQNIVHHQIQSKHASKKEKMAGEWNNMVNQRILARGGFLLIRFRFSVHLSMQKVLENPVTLSDDLRQSFLMLGTSAMLTFGVNELDLCDH